MQESRLDYLKELQKNVQQAVSTNLNLFQYQEEYRQKVEPIQHDLHPKALESELQNIKDDFEILQQNYVNVKAKERILQSLFDDPHVKISVEEIIQTGNRKFKTVDDYVLETETLQEDIYNIVHAIEQFRQGLLSRAEDANKILADIEGMEKEVDRIETFVSNQSTFTIEEASELAAKQENELTALASQMEERKEAIEEQMYAIEDLEEEVNNLSEESQRAEDKANRLLKLNAKRNPIIESEYKTLKKAMEACKQMSGIEKIEYESNTAIHITFAKPITAILHVYLDESENHISNASVMNI
ncbi:hypothetical protein G6F37_009385 [Rhizopus arrhizus]|nr:hypothetical protein G6F38_004444 [Rhizopus arrhizus]KAG1154511.1 hypothetical protein G6F37_009385 [Rhizopus arrhizus]